MTGGEAYRAKLITDDALDAAIAAYHVYLPPVAT